MKRNILLLTITLFLVSQTYSFAQGRGKGKGLNKNRWDKFRTEKIAFLTDRLDLSPEEAQKFWPVYNQMDKERAKINSERFELERQVREASESLQEKEIIELTRSFTKNMQQEGNLGSKYNDQFLKILPARKVLLLYKAEGEFRMYMFRKFREYKPNK